MTRQSRREKTKTIKREKRRMLASVWDGKYYDYLLLRARGVMNRVIRKMMKRVGLRCRVALIQTRWSPYPVEVFNDSKAAPGVSPKSNSGRSNDGDSDGGPRKKEADEV